MDIKILLVSTNIEICEEWESAFKSFSNIEVICEKFQNILHYDCITSSGNSFGMMDGGMDKHLVHFF